GAQQDHAEDREPLRGEGEARGSRRGPSRGYGRPPEARRDRSHLERAVGSAAPGDSRRECEVRRGFSRPLRRESGGRRSQRVQRV
ncbi:MAG: hypothetical protein AVDCRST_MAG28-447, partial [uncultured Rubrobacteraceae bacterium]